MARFAGRDEREREIRMRERRMVRKSGWGEIGDTVRIAKLANSIRTRLGSIGIDGGSRI